MVRIDRRSRTLSLIARLVEYKKTSARWDKADVKALCQQVIQKERSGGSHAHQLRGLMKYRQSISKKNPPGWWNEKHLVDHLIAALDRDIETLSRLDDYKATLRIIAETESGSANAMNIGRFVDQQLKAAHVPPRPYNKTSDRKKSSSRAESEASKFRASIKARERRRIKNSE